MRSAPDELWWDDNQTVPIPRTTWPRRGPDFWSRLAKDLRFLRLARPFVV